MKKFKVVITDYYYENLDNETRELDKLNNITLFAYRDKKTAKQIIEVAHDADAIITQGADMSREAIMGLEKCKIIVKYAIGVNGIDIDAATEKGIFVCNVPDYGIEEVSDHAISLMLACVRKLKLYANQVETKGWTNYAIGKPIYRLKNSRFGLIGFGNIARLVAKKIKGFEFDVVAYDPFIDPDVIQTMGVTPVGLNELIKTSDFISVHTPLTNDTYHLIGAEQFALMKPNVVIVNTARGPVIDSKALTDAIKGGQVAAAGLDAVDPEPIQKDSPLLGLHNVIITPHIAWYSEQAITALQTSVAWEVVNVLSGHQPKNLVNKDLLKTIKI